MEPKIPLHVFVNLVSEPIQRFKIKELAKQKGDVFPSISDLLIQGTVSPQQIEQCIPVMDQAGIIVGYQVSFKKSGAGFYLP
ncbi:hypothetical protein KKH13_02075 [Patescibacteria group bacterium]|nr:hypothetical protein [Patescibacteria group bacterium]